MDQQQAATAVLQKICAALDPFILEDTNTSLLGGYTGIALFYAYYYQLTGREEHLDNVHYIIDKCLQALSEEPMNGSHCSGIAGVAWCIKHLVAMGFIEADDTEDIFTDIDPLVAEFMTAELAEERNDFLHHGLGTALYFLERLPAPIAAAQLENLVTRLEESAITLPGGIAWKDHFSSKSQQHPDENLFNLGLAHGVPAIISVLARCYEKGIAKERTRRLINSSVQWLLRTRNTGTANTHSRFPTIVNAANEAMGDAHSRLGWCYGDLGIAAMLQGVGKRLDNRVYQEEARQLFNHITNYRNLKNGAVHDGCLCHGSAGIAHILQQAGLSTADPALLNASRKWWQHTLEMNTWDDGPAGYKFYHHPDYISSHNVLEGIAGIGLSLISFVDNNIKPAWGECMLID